MAVPRSLRKVIQSFNNEAHTALVNEGMSPHFQVLGASDGPVDWLSGRRCINFSSNDYLGLRRDPRTIAAAQAALAEHGTGLGASRLMCGNIALHRELEERLSDWLGREDTVVFTTGYDANLGVLSALLGPGSVALCDAGVHASIIDGCRLGGATIRRFRSDRLRRLGGLVERYDDRDVLVVAESVYSMEGHRLDLGALLDVGIPDSVGLYVDEAHSLGVVGRDGSGVCRQHPRGGRVDLVMGTMSKSLASCGGFVSGDAELIGALRVNARSLMFTSGSVPAVLGAALAALEIVRQEDERRVSIQRSSVALRAGFREAGFSVGASASQIVPIYLGGPWRTVEFANRLFEAGINAGVAVHPAVPPSRSLLRFCVNALHEDAHIQECIEKVAKIGAELGTPETQGELSRT